MDNKIKLIHIITGLNTGGAEMMLYKLSTNLDTDKFSIYIVSLTDAGPVATKLINKGITVYSLNMRRGLPNPSGLYRLVSYIRKIRPDIIQTWMYHADLIGGIAAKFSGGVPVNWGIRQSTLDLTASKRSTIMTANICAKLSTWLPNKIVCCSYASESVHVELGYESTKMIVISNGFDIDSFVPNKVKSSKFKVSLGLTENTFLIGLVARFDPQKDHNNFIMAAKLLTKTHKSIHFVMCGDHIDSDNKKLISWIKESGLKKQFHLLGRRNDMPSVVAGLDIATSASSFGEGFPNILGEAMSSGVPCVATDVGDSATIIGESGIIVEPRNPEALASGWRKIIELEPPQYQKLCHKARLRIENNYSIAAITKQYERMYQETLSLCVE